MSETGLLVPPGSGEALAAAMLRLVLEPDLRHALGRAAFSEASARTNARI